MQKNHDQIEIDRTNIALIQNDIGYIKKSLDIINILLKDLDAKYVSKVEFWPVKAIVFGGASLMLIGVLATIIFMATGGNVRIMQK